ncbi:MAG: EcsC family protein [Stigonema ocellatum SAG 48.90 = DSM 106950]|nr:EcsC family protein [Stigonema ocellatum SAG 48.90 = DSM 106950]
MKDKPASALPTLSNTLEKSPQEDQPSFLLWFQAGQDGVKKAVEVGEATAKQIQKLLEQVTQGTGRLANGLSEIWLIRKLAGFLNLNWLTGAVDNVNLEKAEKAVKKLQQQHPNESPSQLAHRIMLEKATKAGGIGLATSILPGAATALLLVDLATTTQLQSEMVYQIASAYGLDLKDPARKGEVLGIFGLAFGGGRLLKATGLGLLRNIPFAGAVIDASSNAVMIYSLGYAACRFYEAKLDASKSLMNEATLAQLKQQSENYLQRAIAQEVVMDQILAHMIFASNPDKTWEEILPELQALNISSNSLSAIEQNIKSPQPLDTLLNQLNRDFAVPLLAQCYRIAHFNGEITPDEQKVLDMITTKFHIDLNSIQSAVNAN